MTAPAKREQSTAWDLRTAWGGSRAVRLTLTERCMIGTIVGKVSSVSVTGAFATIDGWHIPLVEVLGVGRPTLDDHERYAKEMRRLRTDGSLEEAA